MWGQERAWGPGPRALAVLRGGEGGAAGCRAVSGGGRLPGGRTGGGLWPHSIQSAGSCLFPPGPPCKEPGGAQQSLDERAGTRGLCQPPLPTRSGVRLRGGRGTRGGAGADLGLREGHRLGLVGSPTSESSMPALPHPKATPRFGEAEHILPPTLAGGADPEAIPRPPKRPPVLGPAHPPAPSPLCPPPLPP